MGKLITMKKDVTAQQKTEATPKTEQKVTETPQVQTEEIYEPQYIDMMTTPELRTLQEIKLILAIILLINIINLFKKQ